MVLALAGREKCGNCRGGRPRARLCLRQVAGIITGGEVREWQCGSDSSCGSPTWKWSLSGLSSWKWETSVGCSADVGQVADHQAEVKDQCGCQPGSGSELSARKWVRVCARAVWGVFGGFHCSRGECKHFVCKCFVFVSCVCHWFIGRVAIVCWSSRIVHVRGRRCCVRASYMPFIVRLSSVRLSFGAIVICVWVSLCACPLCACHLCDCHLFNLICHVCDCHLCVHVTVRLSFVRLSIVRLSLCGFNFVCHVCDCHLCDFCCDADAHLRLLLRWHCHVLCVCACACMCDCCVRDVLSCFAIVVREYHICDCHLSKWLCVRVRVRVCPIASCYHRETVFHIVAWKDMFCTSCCSSRQVVFKVLQICIEIMVVPMIVQPLFSAQVPSTFFTNSELKPSSWRSSRRWSTELPQLIE